MKDRSNIAFLCNCGCLHGWIDHPAVTKVDDSISSRTPFEHIWVCPRCQRQHRTTDGTMLGQLHKAYQEVAVPDAENLLVSMSHCPMTGEVCQTFSRIDGTVVIMITEHGIRFPEQENAEQLDG